ncbi:MAG: DUF928 domain-containing protein [Myxacorys californica WJT36-NPBG1]|nr:DUF928 domain-containing protein [Myxacorys californica WJT36-NPBG1]
MSKRRAFSLVALTLLLTGIYAESGVWWNVLLTLDDLRKAQPQNTARNQQWTSLLDSVGLGAIAQMPILDLKP